METGKKLLKDLAKAFAAGVTAAAAAGILFFICGFLTGGFEILNALEAAKNGLLLIAALGMFLIAGMLLVKGKNPEKFAQKDSWRKHFKILGYKSVLGVLCAAVIAAAAAADYLLFLLK